MSYRVRTESFEGPFDLLLYLVSRQKVSIGSISIARIADQYLEELAHLKELDLDVASDFLLVASTLLEIKAQNLVSQDRDSSDEDYDPDEMSPSEARDVLINRLIRYKQFKNASKALELSYEQEIRHHKRLAGPGPDFSDVLPDFLQGISLEHLGMLACALCSKKEHDLLDSEHIAAKPIPVEVYTEKIKYRLKDTPTCAFSELLHENSDPAYVVVNFLAVLELFKQGYLLLLQEDEFGDLTLVRIEEKLTPTLR